MASKVRSYIGRHPNNAPNFLATNLQYETLTGSHAYGCNNVDSDIDLQGFCIPPKKIIFPHLNGEIAGFSTPGPRFEQWEQQNDEFDATIYSIVKYFKLLMGCNPNVIDSLFTPERCVTHCTQIGRLVKDNRKMFLHKKAYHTFRGYAFAQLKKAKSKNPIGKRKALVEKFGVDVKFLYHLVRLMDEIDQILQTHDINLDQDSERLKSIRRGEWTLERIEHWFEEKDIALEKIYANSTLPYGPNEEAIRDLLLECLTIHYGELTTAIHIPPDMSIMISELESVIDKYQRKLI